MKFFVFMVAAILGLLLPLHGGITVFLPDNIRWWKEGVLFLLFVVVVFQQCLSLKKQGLKKFMASFSNVEIWIVLFFLVADVLFFVNNDQLYALYALRYLLWPLLVFWGVYRLHFSLSQNLKKQAKTIFAQSFVLGLLVSVLFALLFQQWQVSPKLLAYFSAVPSSWVPGQVLQKWHESGGLVRWQGLSSGPIEFSHLLVLGMSLLPSLNLKKYWTNFLFFVFLIAVFFSFSRSAIIASFLIILLRFCANKNIYTWWKTYKKTIIALMVVASVGVLSLLPWALNRAGTIDHFTRPVEALNLAVKSPFVGNLAQIGPAARMKNLQENNNDSALIAENVLVDVLTQMGVFGFLCFIGFLYYLHRGLTWSQRLAFYALFFMMNLATIFDMTPISMAYFYWFGLHWQNR